MDIMTTVAPIVASPWTIGLIIIVLSVWAGVSGYRFWSGTSLLCAALRRATDQVENAETALSFAARYEPIAQELSQDRVLGTRWRAYRQSLLVTEQNSVRATTPSETWFDISLLRTKSIALDPRYHAALPGLLVGAGLLFTFIGLAVALGSAGGIVAENVTQPERNAALHQLLAAASLKFWTSVAGLFLSIGYALLRKRCLRQVESALEGFQVALDERIPLITPVQLQAETNTALHAQAAALREFTGSFPTSIANALDRSLDAQLGHHTGAQTAAIGRMEKSLTAAMLQTGRSLAGQNESAMQSMLSAFLERLHGGAADRMDTMAGKLVGLSTGLEAIQTGMHSAATRMADAAEAMTRRMDEGTKTAMIGVTDQISTLVDTLQTLSLRIGDLNAVTGEAAQPLVHTTQQLQAAADSMRAATVPLNAVTERAAGLMQQIGATAQQLEAAFNGAARLTGSLDNATQRFEGVDKSLALVLTQLQVGVARFATDITHFVTNTDKNLAAATGQVVNMVASLDTSIRDLEQILPGQPGRAGARAGS
jgi:ABC-type transporter Mla subunit MlaD